MEQDYRFIKWRVQNSLAFKNFESARRTLSGIEVIQMLRKNQLISPSDNYVQIILQTGCITFKSLNSPNLYK
ncbi:hypothetical protein D3C87_853160 [compost metagenome]